MRHLYSPQVHVTRPSPALPTKQSPIVNSLSHRCSSNRPQTYQQIIRNVLPKPLHIAPTLGTELRVSIVTKKITDPRQKLKQYLEGTKEEDFHMLGRLIIQQQV